MDQFVTRKIITPDQLSLVESSTHPLTRDETITLTFGEAGQTHLGMEVLGQMSPPGEGFNLVDLHQIKTNFEQQGVPCDLHDLSLDSHHSAYVLVIRGGLQLMGDLQQMKEELVGFQWDQQYFDPRRQRVLQKRARHNVCFGETNQLPDYPNKKGTIVGLSSVPSILAIKTGLQQLIGEKAEHLVCEGNRYFNSSCGIGFHGDTERRRVIGVRLGATMPMEWCWFLEGKSIRPNFKLMLHDGDIYLMSEKAVGCDWKKRNIPTLRHAAGAPKYLKPKQ